MKSDLSRLVGLVAKVGTDQLFGGVRDLYQGLSEERARRFVSWLSSESAAQQMNAAEALTRLLQDVDGERMVRHICRDVLFGTESISLAALAILASEASNGEHDPFRTRAAAAVDGLQNEDAVIFLGLMQHIGDFTVIKEWLPVCHFDVSDLQGKSHWLELETLFGLGAREVYSGINELTQRRLFMPDTARGRLGGVDDVAPSAFLLSPETARFFRLLGRALEIAEPDVFKVVDPTSFSLVESVCCVNPGRPNP